MKANSIGTMIRTGEALVACLLVPACLAATPLLEFKFNETGTTAVNTGSDTGGTTTMKNSSGVATDLHSAGGIGVSGLGTDRAFDNTASTSLGGSGGGANSNYGTTPSPLQSLTMMGWFRDVDDGSSGRIYFNENGAGDRTELQWARPGTLRLELSGAVAATSTFAAYDGAFLPNNLDKWVFFAVTFDGTAGSDQVKFYIGDTSTAASLVNTVGITATSTIHDGSFGLGNLHSGYNQNSAFDGMLDNLRVFGSATDGSGALSLSAIEGFRFLDTGATPEPSTVMLLGLGGLLAFRLRHGFGGQGCDRRPGRRS